MPLGHVRLATLLLLTGCGASSQTVPGPELAPEQGATARSLNIAPYLVNRLGMRFVLIPGRDPDSARASEATMGPVEPFYFQETEVTNAQFRRLVPGHLSGDWRGLSLDEPEQPALRVTPAACDRFIRLLNRITGQRHRLPTEYEWIHAAEADSPSHPPWQDDPRSAAKFDNFADYSYCMTIPHIARDPQFVAASRYYGDDGTIATSPVHLLKPNAWGLRGIYGNAQEWCADECRAEPHVRRRALRGGAFNLPASEYLFRECASVDRAANDCATCGLRLALDPIRKGH
jgi:formylglycine-generating enzyme required for sulfatase activity